MVFVRWVDFILHIRPVWLRTLLLMITLIPFKLVAIESLLYTRVSGDKQNARLWNNKKE